MLNYLYFPLVPLTICTILCRTLTKQTSPFKLSSIEIRESHRRICIMKIIYCRAGDPICFFWLSDPVEALFLSRYLERKKFDWQYNPNQLFGVAVCVQELGSDPIPFRKKTPLRPIQYTCNFVKTGRISTSKCSIKHFGSGYMYCVS